MATMLARIQMHVNADDPTAMAGPVHPEDLPVYPVKTREEFAFLEASLKNEAIFAKLVSFKLLCVTAKGYYPEHTCTEIVIVFHLSSVL